MISDVRIKTFFNGIYSLRATLKDCHTRDSAIILPYIKKMPDALGLEELKNKLSILIATGQSSVPYPIDIGNIFQETK